MKNKEVEAWIINEKEIENVIDGRKNIEENTRSSWKMETLTK